MNTPNEITKYIRDKFPRFGPNKQQEIVRLLYEISKREKVDFKTIITAIPEHPRKFMSLRKELLQRRFPNISSKRKDIKFNLPEVDINSKNCVDTGRKFSINPKHIFVERKVKNSVLAKRLARMFPDAKFETIESYADYVKQKKFSIQDYNRRSECIFIVKELFDFYKKCPCSTKTVSCGYHLINLGVGCPFECSYCCLQGYLNSPGIVFPANLDDFFLKFKDANKCVRLGSGELTDSLVFDDITEFSRSIIEFFRQYPDTVFEFKTKSDNVEILLETPPAENIVIAWSMNPQGVIDTTEFFTASLKQRLNAAKKCVNAGYKIGFHFDPIILYDGWEKDYKHLVDYIFDEIDEKRVAWISLGILRMTQHMKKVIENRFPDNTILDGELIPGYDDKLRYDFQERLCAYSKVSEWIRFRSKEVHLYLCMEEKKMWELWQGTALKDNKKNDFHVLSGVV